MKNLKMKVCVHNQKNVDYFGYCRVCRTACDEGAKAIGWIITHSYIEGKYEGPTWFKKTEIKPITGPRYTPYTNEELQKGHPFKMYDDDDNLYFEGYFLGDKTAEEAFAPLEDYGEGGAGCTKIFYKNGRKWEQL
jgi:hypothetical protein